MSLCNRLILRTYYRRSYNSAELLYHAFEGGELTLLQYLIESDYFFEAYDLRLQTLRDLHLVTAEMNAWQL